MRRTNEVKGKQDGGVCHYLNMITLSLNQTPGIGTAFVGTVLLRASISGWIIPLYRLRAGGQMRQYGSALVGEHMKGRQSTL